MAGSGSYGPALPPGFSGHPKSEDSDPSGYKSIGPMLPPGFNDTPKLDRSTSQDTYGPVLPPELTAQKGVVDADSSPANQRDKVAIGPTMPPGFSAGGSEGLGMIGPAIPPGFVMDQSQESDEDEDDLGMIGPMPHLGPSYTSTEHEFDKRARKMKEKIENKNNPEKVVKRESWMTEIPTDIGKNLGVSSIAPRKLGSGIDKVDTTAWTETPAEREKREQDEREGKRPKRKHDDEVRRVSKRDKDLAKQVKKHNESKRSESLLEMHTKKIKKEKKKKKKEKEKDKDKKPERIPFNRDEDLKINNMDNAKRKALIKRSQELNSKFGHGSKQFI